MFVFVLRSPASYGNRAGTLPAVMAAVGFVGMRFGVQVRL